MVCYRERGGGQMRKGSGGGCRKSVFFSSQVPFLSPLSFFSFSFSSPFSFAPSLFLFSFFSLYL